MRVLRWMFTKEGGAATPHLSAATASALAGIIGGVYFSFQISRGWGVVAGLGMAVALYLVTYPQLRDEHDRQRRTGAAAVAHVPLRQRLRSTRPSAVRLGVLFVAPIIGVTLALAFSSPWPLLLVMVGALIGVTLMRSRHK